MSMFEPELALFQVQIEGRFGNPIELCELALGKAPEAIQFR